MKFENQAKQLPEVGFIIIQQARKIDEEIAKIKQVIKELNMETLLKLIKKIDISNASEVIVKK